MADKFVLITQGTTDSNNSGIVRLVPSCYQKIAVLKRKTGMPLCKILEQCVDFALDHLLDEEDDD